MEQTKDIVFNKELVKKMIGERKSCILEPREKENPNLKQEHIQVAISRVINRDGMETTENKSLRFPGTGPKDIQARIRRYSTEPQ